jgi:hypothetical protein
VLHRHQCRHQTLRLRKSEGRLILPIWLGSAFIGYALSPQAAPVVPARLFLRSGFLCFDEIANAVGLHVPDEPEPSGQISLNYEESLNAVERMCAVDFPIERDPADA